MLIGGGTGELGGEQLIILDRRLPKTTFRVGRTRAAAA